MIGGWRPWQRWMVARRLARHARREGREPPADLLRRLREDIPASPALLRHPDRPPLAGGERRAASRRWLAAAALAAALTAVVVGLRVWEAQPRGESRLLELRSWSGGGPAYPSRRAKGEASPSPALSPARPSVVPAPAAVVPPPSVAPPPPQRQPARSVQGEPEVRSFAEQPTGAGGDADQAAAPSAATAGEGAAQSLEAPRPKLERSSRGGASQSSGRSASTLAAPTLAAPTAAAPAGMSADDAAPAERARGAAPPHPLPPAAAPPPPAAAKVASPELSADAMVAAASPAPQAAPRLGGASPWRSSFGADTGTDFYRRVRRGLLDEGRLPRAASVRADELANAFDLAADVPAVGRPELAVEGAPLPAAGATYLVRFEARGLAGRSSQDTVEVDFDPAVVARFRRVGATAHRGGASALYEIELRPEIAAAPTAPGVVAGSRPDAAGAALAPMAPMAPMAPKPVAASAPAAAPQRAAAPRMKAASPQPAGEPRSAAASRPAAGADRVIATLRVVSRDAGGFRGGAVLTARVVHLHQLHPSWDAASPALRVQGLAVQLARALAARDPGPRLQEVRVRAQALAAELPEDPKAAELLQLVDRAADLAAATGGTTPHPP